MEANREAAVDALDKAKAKKEAGDYASALRLAEKSIKLSPSEKAQAFVDFLKKFGPDSDCAKSVARIIQAADHYAVLELRLDADDKSIKKAYQQLALKIHPDKNAAEGAQSAFQKLSDAFSTLSNPTAKQAYDVKLRYAHYRAPAGAHARPATQPQYKSAGWQGAPRPAAAGAGAASGSAAGGKDDLLREIAQLRHELSDAREQKAVLPMMRSQLKQRTEELAREKAGRQREHSQWLELQRSWHERHAETERRLREATELEAQLRRVARLDKGELENLRVRHDALLKRQVGLEAELEAERAAIDVLRSAIASAGGQVPTEVCRVDGAGGIVAAEPGERRGGQPGEGAGRAMPALGRSTHAIQPRRTPNGTAWRLELTPCVADGRVPVQLTFASGTRSAVMMGRAHGGRDQFGLRDPRISRNHVRVSAGDGLASAGDKMVAIATAVGANAIGVKRSSEAGRDEGSIEIAAKGEAVELRHGDLLLLLAEEPSGTRHEYFVDLRPVALGTASGSDGRIELTAMPEPSTEQGMSTLSTAQAAELAASARGGGGQAAPSEARARMPDASSFGPCDDHATSHREHIRAGAAAEGPPLADRGEAAHAHEGLAADELHPAPRASATLGEAGGGSSPAPKRMRVKEPQGSATGPLSGASIGASLEDPIEL